MVDNTEQTINLRSVLTNVPATHSSVMVCEDGDGVLLEDEIDYTLKSDPSWPEFTNSTISQTNRSCYVSTKSRKTKSMSEKDLYNTKFAIIMSAVTLILMGILSLSYSNIIDMHKFSDWRNSDYKSIILSKKSTKTNRKLNEQQPQQQYMNEQNDHHDNVDNVDSVSLSQQKWQSHRQVQLEYKASEEKDNQGDYKKHSCNYIYEITPESGSAEQCAFARTCNGGDGVWAPFVFCTSSTTTRWIWLGFLSPVMLLWLVLLFRLLGSTAEDYFSPALEMFSVKCNLPPRFAGVTLLALGNGAADVSATVAAITSDPEEGYLLSLGALTGAAMFISVVISAAVILAASSSDGSGSLQCRGAFTRDVVAMLVTVATVYMQLRSGTVGRDSVTAFLTLYCVFVCTVLIADVYHRAVVIPRIRQCAIDAERNRQQLEAQRFAAELEQQEQPQQLLLPEGSNGVAVAASADSLSTIGTAIPKSSSTFNAAGTNVGSGGGIARKVLMALSNYDNSDPGLTGAAIIDHQNQNHLAGRDGLIRGVGGIESESFAPIAVAAAEPPIVLHGAHGILNRHGQGRGAPGQLHVRNTAGSGGIGDNDNENIDDNEYSMLSDEPGENLGVDSTIAGAAGAAVHHHHHQPYIISDTWYEALEDGFTEWKQHGRSIYDDITESDDLHNVQKFLLLCELPVTICRQLTVPIPCDGFYVRSVTATSMALSPLWFAYYLSHSHDYNLWTKQTPAMITVQVIMLVLSLVIIRYGPPTNVDCSCLMSLYMSVPIALYGFIIAATWIDTIADSLVSLLNFIGIVLHIPGPIIGLTVLAWGNSMGDLSANMTMARKGLANMAITACFAGPVFNVLVGLGLGFSALMAKTGNLSIAVVLSSSITTGFAFLAFHSCCILYTGLVYGNGVIPYQYGYVALFIYSIYVLSSITMQYRQ